jgi:glycosyltransferase involved in cell wall biosynthesis
VADVIAQDGVGIALENGDSAGLAGAIRRLRDDPGLREQMGARARSLFESRFDRPVALERHHRLLCRVGGVAC